MDMRNLNIQQVVLLCLLISFVSSITTGIATVSLMQQESEPVTQTINRVVEKTIERVTPLEGEEGNLAALAKSLIGSNSEEKEVVTVVVSQDELTIDAVDKNKSALVKIYRQDRIEKVFVGFGLIVDDKGTVIADSSILNYQNRYLLEYHDQTEPLRAKFVEGFSKEIFSLLEPETIPEGMTFFKPAFADSQQLKLGQAVVAIGGSKDLIISSGIVTQLETVAGVVNTNDADTNSVPADQLLRITTNVDPLGMYTGAVLLNLKGSVIGLRSFDAQSSQPKFIPINIIKTFLTANGR